MALYMLTTRNRQLVKPVSVCSDSQALLKVLSNQHPHTGHYILDKIHNSAESLHAKQDGLLNRSERLETLAEGRVWKGNTNGVIDLQMHWVPGHSGYERNERADEEAKKAAQGLSSEAKLLPPFLCRRLPASISALRQSFMSSLLKMWKLRWKRSPRYAQLHMIDKSAPSKKFLGLIKGLNGTRLRCSHSYAWVTLASTTICFVFTK